MLNTQTTKVFIKIADAQVPVDFELNVASISATLRKGQMWTEFLVDSGCGAYVDVVRSASRLRKKVQIGLQFVSGSRLLLEGYVKAARIAKNTSVANFTLVQTERVVRFAA